MYYKDRDFIHSFTYNSFTESSLNKDKPSKLIGRVICLPYKIEMIMDLVNDVYLVELRKGMAQEIIENERDQYEVARWEECVKHFIACEYFEKVGCIIEKRMGGLDALTLGCFAFLLLSVLLFSILDVRLLLMPYWHVQYFPSFHPTHALFALS